MNSKRSRLQRKYVNAMRGMQEVPWPARRFKYPATTGPWKRRYSTYPMGRLARYVRRAEEVTAQLIVARGQLDELERRQAESRRALEAARRRARRSPRAIVIRIFSRRKV